MKRHLSSFFSGVVVTALVGSLAFTALAATGTVSFNASALKLNGQQISAAGENYTLTNGQSVPASITYTDEKGGGTTYLPVRRISELLGIEVGWDGSVTLTGDVKTTTPPSANPTLTDNSGKEISSYSPDAVNVTVGGEKVTSDIPVSIVYAGRTYLNANTICDALGLDINTFDFAGRDKLSLKGTIYVAARDFSEVTNISVAFNSESNTMVFDKIDTTEGSSDSNLVVLEIGKQYSTNSGYGVTVNSASTNTVKGVPTFTFKYTLKNLTKDKYLNEDTFTIGFTDGTSTNQGGIYMGGMYPNETLTKTYSLILDGKTVSYILFNDGDSFFLTKPNQSDLNSHLTWYIK